MSATNRAERSVTAATRNARASRLLQASKDRQPAIARVDAALDRTYEAIRNPNATFDRAAIRSIYAALRNVRRTAARVRIATLSDIYAAVTWGIPNTRMGMQFEDLSLAHAKTAMLMVAARGTLAAEGDESVTASDLIAIDDNGFVTDEPEDNLSQASGKRASRFSAMALLAQAADGEGDADNETAALVAAAEDLDEACSAAVADIKTPGDDLADVTLPGATSSKRADIKTPGDEAAEKVRTTERDPNTPLDTSATAKGKKADESTDGAGYPISDRDAARANQARRKQAEANDDLPKEPGTTEQNVDTHYRGDPNDPEHGQPNPGDGDASKGERPKFDSKGKRINKRADANDDLPKEPGTTEQNVDTHYRGDPNDPEHGDPNPSDGDASKGERPAFDSKGSRGKRADAWQQGEDEPQTRPSASVVAEGDDKGGDDKGGDSKPAPKPPAAPKTPAAPAPAPAAPAAPAPAPAPVQQTPGLDDMLMGQDPMLMGQDPMMGDPSMLGGDPMQNMFGLPDQNSMDQILQSEILGDGNDMLPPQDAANAADPADPALVPSGDDLSGAAPIQTAQARANALRATKLASATLARSAQAADGDAVLAQMISQDLLS